MFELAHMWHQGGSWSYVLALLAFLGVFATLVLGIAGLTGGRGSPRTLILSTLLCAYGLFVLATGYIGWQSSMSRVETAVAMVNPADRAEILAEGSAEARSVSIFGAAACLPPMLAGVALLGLGLARLKRFAPQPT